MDDVTIIGGGMAGCEAALQLARRGVDVRLYEMRPVRSTEAHQTDKLGELVCSNSFRGADVATAVGLLKEEMRRAGGALMALAEEAELPAGGALAVDRERFAAAVTRAVEAEPRIEIVRDEVTELPDPAGGPVVVATGPLTSKALTDSIIAVTGEEQLYFYDAIAPIVDAESIDRDVVFAQSRYGKGGDDYLNCPMDEDEYADFLHEVRHAELAPAKAFEETKFFEACLPIEVMAARGDDVLRYGPMKPVGLTDPRTGRRPYAVVQLRMENKDATAYNLVGFQTRMKWGEQRRVLQMIPGLESAEFLRFGSVHRNTFVNGPRVLDERFALRNAPHVRLAGQITGVEGYVESMACGLLVGTLLAAELAGESLSLPPAESALGSLRRHVTGEFSAGGTFSPSNINWGLFPRWEGPRLKKRERRAAMAERALERLEEWLEEQDGRGMRVDGFVKHRIAG